MQETRPDPIFLLHQPVNTHIELITREDAGYGLVQTLEAPDEFWGRVYNMSGGPSCRVVYADYLARMMRIFGLGDITEITHPNWFAKRNFHCCWYEDSYILNQYLNHWRLSLEDHYRDVEEAAPRYLKLGGRITLPFLVKGYMKRLADPLRWIQDNDEEKIKAFFGSRQMWESIPDWGSYVSEPSPYAERSREQAPERYTIEHMQELGREVGNASPRSSSTSRPGSGGVVASGTSGKPLHFFTRPATGVRSAHRRRGSGTTSRRLTLCWPSTTTPITAATSVREWTGCTAPTSESRTH